MKKLAELAVLKQRMERMEALGTLAGGVAHDLNNILSGIVGYPGLILMQLPADSPLRESILAIKQSGQKAAWWLGRSTDAGDLPHRLHFTAVPYPPDTTERMSIVSPSSTR